MRKPRRMFILTFIVLIAILVVCLKTCDTRLWMLKSKEMKFNELPKEIQVFLKGHSKNNSWVDLLCVSSADTAFYQTEEVLNPIVSSWVLYSKLKDKKRNKCYHIPRGIPYPYIIYKDKLYISSLYNIMGCSELFLNATYTEYELESAI